MDKINNTINRIKNKNSKIQNVLQWFKHFNMDFGVKCKSVPLTTLNVCVDVCPLCVLHFIDGCHVCDGCVQCAFHVKG